MPDGDYQNPEIARGYADRLQKRLATYPTSITLMEVCGTHTMSIYQHGIRDLLPPALRLVSGPGCPVCVTPVSTLDHAIALAQQKDILIATFGDMVRVPGSASSLLREQALGAHIQIVYSPLDALTLARRNPQKHIVFLGIGFETTAPTVAATLIKAQDERMDNFSVLCAHKTMPAAMAALTAEANLTVDGYLCPAHVSTIIGAEAYRFLAEERRIPCVITGFEPLDILQGIDMALTQILEDRPQVDIQYQRFVTPAGNRQAQALLARVFEPCDAEWRGLGTIASSGLRLREEFASFDAGKIWPVAIPPLQESLDCRCGDILKGLIQPGDCPLFARTCTPENPVGACMVSSEGTCAAAYRFGI
ncbi:hydrogenase formation protein HypD [Desulfuromonas sp. KJ2020]|uniref:hydrogenase formation protein HypD n=1 Tax=Desulfuromonas sp. KJ2020 TaxID=2919173 RepID=UPI0020A6E69C|nr:hydrogenase formation protein HypD [Desulfuromonas sp. KJ2020]MCP3178274.1 hydrogenase formation protein HypD [Desulfuromonas sp. KJ2020]